MEGCGGVDVVGNPTRKLFKNQHIRRQGAAALGQKREHASLTPLWGNGGSFSVQEGRQV